VGSRSGMRLHPSSTAPRPVPSPAARHAKGPCAPPPRPVSFSVFRVDPSGSSSRGVRRAGGRGGRPPCAPRRRILALHGRQGRPRPRHDRRGIGIPAGPSRYRRAVGRPASPASINRRFHLLMNGSEHATRWAVVPYVSPSASSSRTRALRALCARPARLRARRSSSVRSAGVSFSGCGSMPAETIPKRCLVQSTSVRRRVLAPGLHGHRQPGSQAGRPPCIARKLIPDPRGPSRVRAVWRSPWRLRWPPRVVAGTRRSTSSFPRS
jgi:hypothetical protein